MNKAGLIAAVQRSVGGAASQVQAERAVEAVVHGIKVGLKKEKSVQLVGFGSFKVVACKAWNGVNAKTGEKIRIAASKGVKFAAGKELKAKIAK